MGRVFESPRGRHFAVEAREIAKAASLLDFCVVGLYTREYTFVGKHRMQGVRYRGGRAEFHKRIPQDCLPVWNQHNDYKGFFHKPLEVSKGHPEEDDRALKANKEFLDVCAAIRAQEYPNLALEDWQLEVIGEVWFRDWAHENAELTLGWNPHEMELQDFLQDDKVLHAAVTEFIASRGWACPPSSRTFAAILNECRQTPSPNWARPMPEPVGAPALVGPLSHAPSPNTPAQRLADGWDQPVGVLVERYLKDKNVSRDDASEIRLSVVRLERAIGNTEKRRLGEVEKLVGEKAPCQFDELDVKRFFKALPLVENDRGSNEYISEPTCRKTIGQVRQFFDWLRNEVYYSTPNPFRGEIKFFYPKDEDHSSQDEPAESYTIVELNTVFASAFFAGHQRRFVFTPGDTRDREDDRFWIAPVSLFTGMRVGEIADLEFQDIAKLYGRDFFCINLVSHYGHKKSTKNDASIRVVPVHRTLIQMGFLDWVKKRSKASDDGRIFRRKSEDYSKFWNEKLTQHPLVNVWQYRRKTFHSLRHNFQDALINAAPDMERGTDRLLGHTIDKKLKYGTKTGPHGVVYEHGVLQPEHAAIIDRVSYVGLVLPH